jgi:hypothetical protein
MFHLVAQGYETFPQELVIKMAADSGMYYK